MTRVVKVSDMDMKVDDADYLLVSSYKWHLKVNKSDRGNTYYAAGYLPGYSYHYAHTLITGWPLVDHINGNGLDNQRSNLRQATRSQNSMNMRPIVGTSRYKGVSWKASQKRWRVVIMKEGKSIYVGSFREEINAARAYDNAARIHHGEFARLNFPEGSE